MNAGNATHPLRTSFQPASQPQNSNPPLSDPAPPDGSAQGIITSGLSDSTIVSYLDDLGHGQDANSDASNNTVQSAADLRDMLRSAAVDQKLVLSTEGEHHDAVAPMLGAEAKNFLTDLPKHKENWSARVFGHCMSKLFKGGNSINPTKRGNSLSLTRSEIEQTVACGFAAILYMHYEAKNLGACRTAATSLLKRCAVIVSELNQYVRYLTNKAELSSQELLDLEHYSALAADIQHMVLSKDMPRAAVPYITTARAYLAQKARQVQRRITPERFSWHPLSYIRPMFPFARIEIASKNPGQFKEVTYEEYVRKIAPDLQLSCGAPVQEPADALPVRVNEPSEVKT